MESGTFLVAFHRLRLGTSRTGILAILTSTFSNRQRIPDRQECLSYRRSSGIIKVSVVLNRKLNLRSVRLWEIPEVPGAKFRTIVQECKHGDHLREGAIH